MWRAGWLDNATTILWATRIMILPSLQRRRALLALNDFGWQATSNNLRCRPEFSVRTTSSRSYCSGARDTRRRSRESGERSARLELE
jgi:hypothetical protein